MELHEKEAKIRDLVVYELGLLPTEIVIENRKITLVFKKSLFEQFGHDVSKVQETMTSTLGRTTVVTLQE